MIIFVLEDMQVSNDRGQAMFVISKSQPLTVIRYDYIPRDSTVHGINHFDTPQDIEKDYYIIYVYRRYIALPKKKCYKPLTDGWYFNL